MPPTSSVRKFGKSYVTIQQVRAVVLNTQIREELVNPHTDMPLDVQRTGLLQLFFGV